MIIKDAFFEEGLPSRLTSSHLLSVFDGAHTTPFGEVRVDLSRVLQNWTKVLEELDFGFENWTFGGEFSGPRSELSVGRGRLLAFRLCARLG
jgi:hypothetical protein